MRFTLGYYKNLLVKAEAGDREAIVAIANDFILKKDYWNAIRWLEKAGDANKAEKLRKLIKEEKNV